MKKRNIGSIFITVKLQTDIILLMAVEMDILDVSILKKPKVK